MASAAKAPIFGVKFSVQADPMYGMCWREVLPSAIGDFAVAVIEWDSSRRNHVNVLTSPFAQTTISSKVSSTGDCQLIRDRSFPP